MRKIISLIGIFLFFLFALVGFYFLHRYRTVRQARKLTIGTIADYEPFTFMRDGIISGLDIDIITEIAQRLEINFSFKILAFEDLIPAVKRGTVNVLATALTETPERAKDLFFTESYVYGNPFLIIIPINSKPVRDVYELKGKAVIVNTGHISDQFLSKIPGISLIRVPTVEEAFDLLMDGKGYAYVNPRSGSEPFLEKYGKNRFHLIPIEETSDASSIAVTRDDPELFEKIKDTLEEMDEDGTLSSLKRKWNLS